MKEFMEEKQKENDNQYKAIFSELAQYLEETELSDLRESVLKSLEEKEKDQENDLFEEIIANEDICCPICCKDQIEIEFVNANANNNNNSNPMPIYSCLCGVKFQPNADISSPISHHSHSNLHVQIGQKMLKMLKNTLQNLMTYHSQQLHCAQQLNFAVIPETGYLQCWCCQCNCNEIVI
eukprot:UN07425